VKGRGRTHKAKDNSDAVHHSRIVDHLGQNLRIGLNELQGMRNQQRNDADQTSILDLKSGWRKYGAVRGLASSCNMDECYTCAYMTRGDLGHVLGAEHVGERVLSARWRVDGAQVVEVLLQLRIGRLDFKALLGRIRNMLIPSQWRTTFS
jgi:hypothetical protein